MKSKDHHSRSLKKFDALLFANYSNFSSSFFSRLSIFLVVYKDKNTAKIRNCNKSLLREFAR